MRYFVFVLVFTCISSRVNANGAAVLKLKDCDDMPQEAMYSLSDTLPGEVKIMASEIHLVGKVIDAEGISNDGTKIAGSQADGTFKWIDVSDYGGAWFDEDGETRTSSIEGITHRMGNVGLNIVNPTEALDISGRVRLRDPSSNLIIGSTLGSGDYGTHNVFLGYSAGAGTTNGQRRVSIGYNAAASSNAFYTVDLGWNAGQNNSQSNVINIGRTAGQNNTGFNTVNLGAFNTGRNNSGSNTVNIGDESGENNSGVHSINIGSEGGKSNSGSQSINIGRRAGQENVGINNINFGFEAGKSSIRNSNINVGFQTGKSSNSLEMIAIGTRAGENAVGSNYGIFIGIEAGRNTSSTGSLGQDAIGIGRFALQNNQGFENVAIGQSALKTNTTGQRSVAVGVGAGQLNTTGEDNTYIGWRAGYQNNGDRNTMLGESANDQAYGGNENTYVGTRTAHDNGEGDKNTGVGMSALHYSQTIFALGMVTDSTYEIFGAGTTDFTTLGALDNGNGTIFQYNGNSITGNGRVRSLNEGDHPDNNTAIGYQAGQFIGTGSNNVFLGYRAGPTDEEESPSEKLYIDNEQSDSPLIGGDFSTDVLEIGGELKFSVQYPPDGTGVQSNTCIFEGTDGVLYKKVNGVVTPL